MISVLLKILCAGILVAGFLVGCRETSGSPDEAVVVTCGVELGLEPKDNFRKDWSGELRHWSAESAGDTLRLVRRGRCGDECNFEEEIVLVGLADSCPQFVSARSSRRDAGSPVPGGGGKVLEARSGSLEIQDWFPSTTHRVVSGRLTSEFSATFYLELDPGQ